LLAGSRLPWFRAPFDSTLSAVFSALGTLLLAFNPPFLASLALLNFATLALFRAITAALLQRAPLPPPVRVHLPPIATPFRLLLATTLLQRAPLPPSIHVHLPPIATPFCLLLATTLLPALSSILPALRSSRITTIPTSVRAIFTPFLAPLGTLLSALASALGPVLAPVFAAFCADVATLGAPVITPVSSPSVPWTFTIIAVPIGIDRETDDRHFSTRAVDY
jgi:hypothetical protein